MLNCSVEPERGPAAKAKAAACGTPCGMPCGMPVWTPQPRVGLGEASCFLPFPIPFPLPRPPFPSPFFFHFCYVLHSNLISVLFPRFLFFLYLSVSSTFSTRAAPSPSGVSQILSEQPVLRALVEGSLAACSRIAVTRGPPGSVKVVGLCVRLQILRHNARWRDSLCSLAHFPSLAFFATCAVFKEMAE